MNVYTATLVNGFVLIAMSFWAYFPEQASKTALIPALFGAAFLFLSPGVKVHNKVVAHIAVLLAVIVLIALFKPLTGALDRGDAWATFRVGLMLLTTLWALVCYVKSFIDVRKARTGEKQ